MQQALYKCSLLLPLFLLVQKDIKEVAPIPPGRSQRLPAYCALQTLSYAEELTDP
jgi:hypothetical protein